VSNKYVDFVSDIYFEKCVRWVVGGYNQERDIRKNGIDAFKTIFDMINTELDFEQWKNVELTRQKDKNISNKIGEFHQKLLGGVKGWQDLQTGDVADLCNDQKTIFLELKNKDNTVKGSDMIHLWKRLDKITRDYPKSIAKTGDLVLVGKHMIEHIEYKSHSYDIVLENHIVIAFQIYNHRFQDHVASFQSLDH